MADLINSETYQAFEILLEAKLYLLHTLSEWEKRHNDAMFWNAADKAQVLAKANISADIALLRSETETLQTKMEAYKRYVN